MARDCVTVELGTAIESKELHRMKVIDITPSPEGFANIARFIAGNILQDVKQSRREDTRVLLASLVETVGYLGAVNRSLVTDIIADIRRES